MLEPIKTGGYGAIALLSAQGEQGDGRGVQMWRQRNSVNHTVSGIPPSAGADAI
jgi:hypothetical protein